MRGAVALFPLGRNELSHGYDDEEHLLQDNKDAIHQAIGEGLAQLDRGLSNTGDVSRARLQERKASWIDSRKPSS
jgi:hypothetical protein